MDEMNIGEIAQLAGIQTSAIRYYESIGLVPPPKRSSGWRRYDSGVLRRLSVIRTAREIGFTLEEIKVLLDGFPMETAPSERWQQLAAQKLPEVEALIERALILKSILESGLKCNCESVEECITSLGEACRTPRSAPLVFVDAWRSDDRSE